MTTCAYCERRIKKTDERFRSRWTGEVYCVRQDCDKVGKKIRKARKNAAAVNTSIIECVKEES